MSKWQLFITTCLPLFNCWLLVLLTQTKQFCDGCLTQPNHVIFWYIYYISFWRLMICAFVISAKKMFFILDVAHNDLFFCQLGPKKQFFKGFTFFFFFRTTGFQHILILIESSNIIHWKSTKKGKWAQSFGEYLGQIRSNVVKNKETGSSTGVFSYYAWGTDLSTLTVSLCHTVSVFLMGFFILQGFTNFERIFSQTFSFLKKQT